MPKPISITQARSIRMREHYETMEAYLEEAADSAVSAGLSDKIFVVLALKEFRSAERKAAKAERS
jgi:hypothetical protein